METVERQPIHVIISGIGVMDSPEPILGVTVFEGLGIRIDPATGKLEYSRPYGLSAIYAISGQKLLTTYKS